MAICIEEISTMKTGLFLAACALPLFAADPPGFHVWTPSSLKDSGKALSAKLDGSKFASQSLEKYGNHYTMLAHREGNGGAELHETEADIFVVESGNATLIVGGKIADPKNTAPHEVRGTSIEGGVEKKLTAGDIVHIPAKTPHQLKIASGEFTYFVVKVQGQ
jgi:mannose-6-phosphate isomerase-like protein (cupin superfamily)